MTDESNPSEGGDHLSAELELVTQACQYLPGSKARGRFLSKLIREIVKSGKLWKENTPYYEEALQKTWIYLSQNLCEATTAKRPYDPEESCIYTWLNAYLKMRLLDCRQNEQKQQQQQKHRRIVSLEGEQNEAIINSIENQQAEPDASFYVAEVIEWIETDPHNELKSRHIRGKPQINCQVLLQRQCLYGQSFQEIAKDLGCAHSTLYELFNNDCRHLLQKFCEDQGYQTLNIPGVYQNNES
jgi:hypothetical protein